MSDSIPSEDAFGRLTEYHHLELRDNYRAEIRNTEGSCLMLLLGPGENSH